VQSARVDVRVQAFDELEAKAGELGVEDGITLEPGDFDRLIEDGGAQLAADVERHRAREVGV
jgi:hypothetical protein